MKRVLLLCALCALFGCRQANNIEINPITLCYSTSEQSKTDILTQGDQIGIFAAVEGTENYFLDNRKYVVGSDGRSLSTSPAVYYPEAKQAVAFTAYLPFGGVWNGAVGTFSVPADQSTSLKQADLCWAKASSTPMAAPVPLEFNHKMARLLITTNEPTSKIVIPNVFSGGTLDIKTGTFTNTLKSSLSTSGTELILPAQTITRLILTIAGVEYLFDGSISLETAKTTSISLTLNPTTKTATLSGSSTTNWISSARQGNASHAVSNTLMLHWAPAHSRSAQVDKVLFSIKDVLRGSVVDYAVSNGIAYTNGTFTVPFSSLNLNYPYTIQKIAFYRSNELFQSCNLLLGNIIYKSGASTLGIKDVGNAVFINGLWWAMGSLVADGANDCKIGDPIDGGLYFQFCSLIGWSGGAAPSYNGTGAPTTAAATVKVKPIGLHSSFDPGATWPTGASTSMLNKSYFSVTTAPYLTPGTNVRSYVGAPTSGVGVDLTKANLGTGRYLPLGVGDPCSHYLGGNWRMPLFSETAALFGLPVTLIVWTPMVGATVSYNAATKIWRFTRSGAVLEFPASQTRRTASEWDPTGGGNFDGNHTAGWNSTELHERGVPGGTPSFFVSIHLPNQWIPSASYECLRNEATPIRCVRSS